MKKLFVWLLAAAAGVVSAQVRQAAGEIVLDGKLDDAAWKKAVVHSDFRPFANSFVIYNNNEWTWRILC